MEEKDECFDDGMMVHHITGATARSARSICRPQTLTCTSSTDQNYACTTPPTLSSVNQSCVTTHSRSLKLLIHPFTGDYGTSQAIVRSVQLRRTRVRTALRCSSRYS